MLDLISVIIPVYNSEKYIKACCKSVINQTYKNLEIIIVNDGSTDASLSICHKMAKQDNRIKVYNSNSKGVSEARNIGITHSAGEYICFVDSDDLLPSYAIKNLYDKLKKNQADFCQGSIVGIYEVHNYPIIEASDRYANSCDHDAWRAVVGNLYWGPVASLYKTSIIKGKQITFPTGVKLAEDSIFLANYIQYCQCIITCKECVYLYNRINNESATKKGHIDAWKWLYDFTEAYEKIYPDEYKYKKYAVEEIALRNLDYTYRHYINICSFLEKDLVLQYMELTYDQFKIYLNDFSEDNIIQIDAVKVAKKYKEKIKTQSYESIYDEIKEENTNEQKAIIKKAKKKMKKHISYIRLIRYYGLHSIL